MVMGLCVCRCHAALSVPCFWCLGCLGPGPGGGLKELDVRPRKEPLDGMSPPCHHPELQPRNLAEVVHEAKPAETGAP